VKSSFNSNEVCCGFNMNARSWGGDMLINLNVHEQMANEEWDE